MESDSNNTGSKKMVNKNVLWEVLLVLVFVLLVFAICTYLTKKNTDSPIQMPNHNLERNENVIIESLPDLEQSKIIEKTELISYHPKPYAAMEYMAYKGNCEPGSVYFNRNDIYNCTSEEIMFDTCFKLDKQGLLLCGVDPLNQESGALFEAENELKENTTTGNGNNDYFLLELEDGKNCISAGNINLSVNGKRAKYQCFGEKVTAIFDEPDQISAKWEVELSILAGGDKDGIWEIQSTETGIVRKAWQ